MHVEATVPPPPAILPAAPARPVAHWLHTLGLLIVLAGTTTFSHYHAPTLRASKSHVAEYIASIVLEWILFGIVIAGIRQRRAFLRTAFSNRSLTWMQALGMGVAAYLAGMVAIALINGLLYFTPLFHQRNTEVVLALLPHTRIEFLLWFLVSLTAGLTEEMIFRGYLQQQLTAWLQRPVLAIVLASFLFGSVHLYEGLAAILPLAALAFVYGSIVRYYRGDLRSVIVAHTLQDFLIALIVFAKPALDEYQKHPH
jgi:membrane protease YdiL (CAAX protease family)